jgi:hypothetical protein
MKVLTLAVLPDGGQKINQTRSRLRAKIHFFIIFFISLAVNT